MLKAPLSDNLAILDFNFAPNNDVFHLFSLPSSFVPTPPPTAHHLILKQVKDFARKLQWHNSLPTTGSLPRFGLHKSERWPPETFVPPHTRRRQISHSKTFCNINIIAASNRIFAIQLQPPSSPLGPMVCYSLPQTRVDAG